MKKLVSLALAILTLISVVAFTGCGQSTRTAVVDVQDLGYNNEIIVYDGNNFYHETQVLDYVKGKSALTSAALAGDVVGVFAQVQITDKGEETIANKAILADGSIVTLNTHLGIIPREWSFDFDGPNGQKILFNQGIDESCYNIAIQFPNEDGTLVTKMTVDQVVDAWSNRHRAYWMRLDHKVYVLDWDNPNAKPERYFDGALAVSHHGDEAEGAIVNSMYSNWSGYGWNSIYSPYGNKIEGKPVDPEIAYFGGHGIYTEDTDNYYEI